MEKLLWLLLIPLLSCAKKPAPKPVDLHSLADVPAQVAERPDPNEEILPLEPPGFTFYFDLDSDQLREQGKAVQLAAFLAESGKAVSLDGHACPLGSDAYNQELGRRRAQAVADFLERHGARIQAVRSHGESRTVTENESEYHLNRRVETVFER